jgi:hypothetical protein
MGTRWAAGLVAPLLPMVLWWAVGAPWPPLAAAVAGGLVARILCRSGAGRVLPRRLRRPVAAASMAGMVALAVTGSARGWLLEAA